MNLNCYASLTDFRTRQGLASTDTADDARMLSKLRAATEGIDRFTGRRFWPVIATRYFDCPKGAELFFTGLECMAITSITNGDGVTAVLSTDYAVLGGVNGPIYGVELDPAKNYWVFLTTRTKVIAVTGVWGYHDDYTNAFRLSGQVIPGGGITASATTFSVTSTTAVDTWGLTPNLQVGYLIKVDSEYMQVIAVNTSTHLVTVIRGVNGSTAAIHSAAATISVYLPPADIPEQALKWAAWLYKTEDAGDYSGDSADAVIGGVHVSPKIPADVRDALTQLRKVA